MALVDQINSLASRIAQEIKAVKGTVAEKAPLAHAHSGADLTSGTVPNAVLPARLQAVSQSVTGDWNSYTSTGFYRGPNLMNAPITLTDAQHWFFVMVQAHSDANYISQTAYYFFGNRTFFRRRDAGIWSAWQEVSVVGHTHNDLYAALQAGVPAGGATGQVLVKTGAGDHATGWANPSGGGAAAAQTLTLSLAEGSFAVPAQYAGLKVSFSAACRFRLYQTAAGRTADAPRAATTIYNPESGNGLVYEFVADAAETDWSEPFLAVRGDAQTDAFYRVDGGIATITLTIKEF